MKQLWKKKKSKVHGSGLFATLDIKKKSQVIEYIGDKITKALRDISTLFKDLKQHKKTTEA